MDYLAYTLITGVGATVVMDLWGMARKRLLGMAPPDYGLVGRWLAHMRWGRFRHDAISRAQAVRGERLIGWAAHYLIGIAFAGVLIGIWGLAWVRQPTIVPALLVGVGTVAAPFFLMQPGTFVVCGHEFDDGINHGWGMANVKLNRRAACGASELKRLLG